MNKEDWLEKRRKSIGASDAPIIMGDSPYRTVFDLWADKVYGFSQPDNPSMERGRRLEAEALSAFESITGMWMVPMWKKSKENPFMTANLDGFCEEKNVAVEIKCPSAATHEEALAGIVPMKYFAQLQHQMYVTEIDTIYYFSYHPSHANKTAPILLPRDEVYVKSLIEKESAFWDLVITKTEPTLEERDIREVPNEWKSTLDRIGEIEQLVSAPMKELEDLKEWLKSQASARCYKGYGYSVKVFPRKGAVDYKSIPELKGVDLEAYRKEGSKTVKVERL